MSESGQGEDRRSWWDAPEGGSTPRGDEGRAAGDAETTAVPSDSGDPYRQAPTQSVLQYGTTGGSTSSDGPAGGWSSPHEQPQPPQWGGQSAQGPDGYPPLNGGGPSQPAQPQPGLPQYGQPQFGQPQYGQPAHGQGSAPAWGGQTGYPQQAPVAGSAHAVLWTAVGGLVFFGTGLGWIAAIVALALTPGARRTILESGGAQRGLGYLLAGKIVAWVTIGVTVLVLIGLGLLFGLLLSGQGSYSDYDFNTVSAFVPAPGA